MKRGLVWLNVLAALAIIAIGFKSLLLPSLAAAYWAEDYKRLMFKCDQVMREHFIAKKEVELAPSEEAVKALDAAEMGLLDCHEYDKLRKAMTDLGVSESRLSSIGLSALEEKKYELRKFVEIHEIRY
jgi:hypothetical protein